MVDQTYDVVVTDPSIIDPSKRRYVVGNYSDVETARRETSGIQGATISPHQDTEQFLTHPVSEQQPQFSPIPMSQSQVVVDSSSGKNVPYGESTQFANQQKSAEFEKNLALAQQQNQISPSSATELRNNFYAQYPTTESKQISISPTMNAGEIFSQLPNQYRTSQNIISVGNILKNQIDNQNQNYYDYHQLAPTISQQSSDDYHFNLRNNLDLVSLGNPNLPSTTPTSQTFGSGSEIGLPKPPKEQTFEEKIATLQASYKPSEQYYGEFLSGIQKLGQPSFYIPAAGFAALSFVAPPLAVGAATLAIPFAAFQLGKEAFSPYEGKGITKTILSEAPTFAGYYGASKIGQGINTGKIQISDLTSNYPTQGKINEIITTQFKIPKTYSSFEMMYGQPFQVDKSFKFEPSPFIKENAPLYPNSPIPTLAQDEFGSFSKVNPQEYPQHNLYGKPISQSELKTFRNMPLKNIPEVSSDVFSRSNPQQQLFQDVISTKKGLTYEPIVETTPISNELKGYLIKYEEIPYKTEPRMTIPRRYILNQEPKVTLAEGYGIREPQQNLIDLGFLEPVSKSEKGKLSKLPQPEFSFESKSNPITSFTTSFEKPKGLPKDYIPLWMQYGQKDIPSIQENFGVNYLSTIQSTNEPFFDIDITGGRYRGKGKYEPSEELIQNNFKKQSNFQEPYSRIKSRVISIRINTSRQKDKVEQSLIQIPSTMGVQRTEMPIFQQFQPTRVNVHPEQIFQPESKITPQGPLTKIRSQNIISKLNQEPTLIPKTNIPPIVPPPKQPKIKTPKVDSGFPLIPPSPKGNPNFNFGGIPKSRRKGGYTSSLLGEEYGIKAKGSYKQLASKTYSGLEIRGVLSNFTQKSRRKRR